MSVPRKENPNQYGDILLSWERRREQEAVADRKEHEDDVHAWRAPRLQKSLPEQGGGYRMFTPLFTSLIAKGLRVLGVRWRGV